MDAKEVPEQIDNTPFDAVCESIQNCKDSLHRVSTIISKIGDTEKSFNDEIDASIHPSYTNFKVPYHMTCRLRYTQKKIEYEQQFQQELSVMLDHQPTAYDAARFNRHLCITTLWPPLHNRTEIEYFQNYFFRLSRKQSKRLEFLMNSKII